MVPLPIVLVVVALAVAGERVLPAREARVLRFLALGAVLAFVAWAIKAPWQHARYMWPGVVFFFIGGGVALVLLHRQVSERVSPLAGWLVACVPFGFAAAAAVVALRLVVMGAAMQTNTAGQDDLEAHFRPFWLLRDQEAAVAYLREEVPEGATVVAVHLPPEVAGLQLSLLSGRRIVDFEDWEGGTPDLLLTHPFASIDEGGRDWLAAVAEPVNEAASYTFHRPTDAWRPPEEDIRLERQLYRFTLSRVQSITGGR
jgi:hypothetical protein